MSREIEFLDTGNGDDAGEELASPGRRGQRSRVAAAAAAVVLAAAAVTGWVLAQPGSRTPSAAHAPSSSSRPAAPRSSPAGVLSPRQTCRVDDPGGSQLLGLLQHRAREAGLVARPRAGESFVCRAGAAGTVVSEALDATVGPVIVQVIASRRTVSMPLYSPDYPSGMSLLYSTQVQSAALNVTVSVIGHFAATSDVDTDGLASDVSLYLVLD